MLNMLYSDLIAGVIIGFPIGEVLTVTEGNEGNIMVCPEILDGVLERDVSVFASTLDVTARGTADTNWLCILSVLIIKIKDFSLSGL